MYNKNGLVILNRPLSGLTGSSQSLSTTGLMAGLITYTDGTTNTLSTVYYAYSTNIVAEGLSKFNITGRASAGNISTTSYPSCGYRIVVGYRATAFTEDTYTALPQSYASMSSVSVVAGVPTVTLVNTSSANITINEVVFETKAGDSSSNINKYLVFAGFHFPDITLAPGDSYTFTFSHKNS